MSYDGSTSGEPYFWQTPDSNYREWHNQSDEGAPRDTCECCNEGGKDESELVHDAAFGGLVCRACRDEWFLASTSARRNVNFGGEWTR